MNDRENDNRNNEGRQVQQELEDQLRAFGDTMTDAFAHGFEGRGMDIGDRAWDVGKAAVHAANYGIGQAAKAFRQGRKSSPYGDAKQTSNEGGCGCRCRRDARLVPADLCKAGAYPGGKYPYQRQKTI